MGAKAYKLTQEGVIFMATMARTTPRSARADIGVTGPIAGTPLLPLAQHYVMHAALAHLDRWITMGEGPPKAPRLEAVAGDNDGTLPRLLLDVNGIAKRGIRTPWVDAPIARMSGIENSGSVVAGLTGLTEPLDRTTLNRLYPGGRNE